MADRNITYKRLWKVVNLAEGMAVNVPPDDNLNLGSIPSSIDPFSESSTQLFPLGTRLEYAERVFRYGKHGGTAQTVGKVHQMTVPLAGHIDEVLGTHAIGATAIDFTPAVITTDDLAADDLAGGYLLINDDTGEGYMYRIKSHPAIVGGVVGVLTLYDPLVVALGAAATGTVHWNPHKKLIIVPSSGPSALVAGVTVRDMSANYYGWYQVKGPCPVLSGPALIIGDKCVCSTATAGAVMASVAGETEGPTIGVAMNSQTDTEYVAVWLHIE